MKRFEFRLDGVLRWREVQLEGERLKLQHLLADQHRLTVALETVLAERLQAKTFISNLANLANTELRSMSAFLVGMEARNGALRNRLLENSELVKEQRGSVLKAERNVTLLKKLREEKLKEWRREMDRTIEAVALDSWLAARHQN